MSASASVPSAGNRATPAETGHVCPATAGSAAIPSRTRCATIDAGRAGRDEHELVAADPPDGVDQPDRLGQHRRDPAQDVVAGLMPAVAVGRPEVVDVEHRERDLAALPAGAGELELEDAADRPLVGEPGQRVACGPCARTTRSARRRSTRGAPARRRAPPARRSASRASRSSASSARGAGQPKPIDPSDDLDAAAGDERAAGRRRRTPCPSAAVASRSNVATRALRGCRERMGRVGDRGRQSRVGIGVHPGRRGELEAGPVGILDEDGAHRAAASTASAAARMALERRLEVAGARRRRRRGGEGRAGVAGRASVDTRHSCTRLVGRRPHRTPRPVAPRRPIPTLTSGGSRPRYSAREARRRHRPSTRTPGPSSTPCSTRSSAPPASRARAAS